MSLIQASSDIYNLPEGKELTRYIQLFLQNVSETVNGNLEFGINLKTKVVTVVFGQANVSVAVPHGLGKVPQGYILAGKSASGVNVFDGTGKNTVNLYYLQSSSAGTAKIIFF